MGFDADLTRVTWGVSVTVSAPGAEHQDWYERLCHRTKSIRTERQGSRKQKRALFSRLERADDGVGDFRRRGLPAAVDRADLALRKHAFDRLQDPRARVAL